MIGNILDGRDAAVVAVSADTPVIEAVRMLAEKRIGALPVLAGDRLIGIFSERDVIYCLAGAGAAAIDKAVGELMTDSPVTVTRDTPVMAALSLMTRRRVRHLPVMEGERLGGLVSIGDLVKYRIDRIEKEAAAMRDYISQ